MVQGSVNSPQVPARSPAEWARHFSICDPFTKTTRRQTTICRCLCPRQKSGHDSKGGFEFWPGHSGEADIFPQTCLEDLANFAEKRPARMP
jgi:hypothetical protein